MVNDIQNGREITRGPQCRSASGPRDSPQWLQKNYTWKKTEEEERHRGALRLGFLWPALRAGHREEAQKSGPSVGSSSSVFFHVHFFGALGGALGRRLRSPFR